MNFKKKNQSPTPKGMTNPQVSFPEAIKAVMGGFKIRRAEWADIKEHGLLKDSLLMIYRNDKFHTWILSEGDMMAMDWLII